VVFYLYLTKDYIEALLFMWRALNMLQQENNMRRTFEQLQAGALPALQKFRIPEMLSISNHRFVNITNITIGLKL
jgi:hypothetical protein